MQISVQVLPVTDPQIRGRLKNTISSLLTNGLITD
jgi:hypothetical protein